MHTTNSLPTDDRNLESIKQKPPKRAASEGKNEKKFYMNPHKEAFKHLF